MLSVKNNRSVAATLAEGNTFAGTFENCTGYNSIVVRITSTSSGKYGLLLVEFSENKTTVSIEQRIVVTDKELGRSLTCATGGGTYCRIRFKALDIADTRSVTVANSFANLKIATTFSNVAAGHFDINIANQCVPLQGIETFATVEGGLTLHRLIAASLVDASVATFPFPTSNCPLRVVTSGADDSVGGTGAQTFVVHGLDENFQPVFWFGDFVAAGASTSSPTQFIRVNSIELLTFGSSGKPTPGSIISVEIFAAGTWQTVLTLDAAVNYKPDACMFSVPAGHTCELAYADVSYNTTGDSSGVTFGIVRNGQAQVTNAMTILNGNFYNGDEQHKVVSTPVTALPGDTFVGEVELTGTAYVLSVDGALRLRTGQPAGFP